MCYQWLTINKLRALILAVPELRNTRTEHFGSHVLTMFRALVTCVDNIFPTFNVHASQCFFRSQCFWEMFLPLSSAVANVLDLQQTRFSWSSKSTYLYQLIRPTDNNWWELSANYSLNVLSQSAWKYQLEKHWFALRSSLFSKYYRWPNRDVQEETLPGEKINSDDFQSPIRDCFRSLPADAVIWSI